MLCLLVVLKKRPRWQCGLLNLPGGKIDPGETPEQAVVREVKEETGLDPLTVPKLMGVIDDESAKIYCFDILVPNRNELSPRLEEDEVVSWCRIEDLVEDPRLIPNLRIIIPLIMAGIRDWVITDSYRSSNSHYHKLEMQIPTYYSSESK